MKQIINLLVYYPTNTNIHIDNIINDCFESLKFYLFRLEYSLDDYERRQIPLTYQTFRTAIWLTLNSWIDILFAIHLAFYPNNFLRKIMQSFEQLFQFERIDLLLQFQISVFIIFEYPWWIFFRKILHYNFQANNFFCKYRYHFNDNQLDNDYRQYLIRLICIAINLLLRSLYLTGQLFSIIKYLLFLIELLKLQIKQIILRLQRSIQYCRFNFLIYRIFRIKYDKLNRDVFILNQTISLAFFSIETMSKMAIIYCSLFYSKQKQ
uniref:Uncharacterized protein LOC113796543 n=1 Tax=Dermatophagoides pteronyssinus TaxID=6956 RepID=A0A6P6YCJ3_DERPT